MSASEEVKFSLKVVINKEKNKVLFAEVDSSFADVLISFMTLPLGTIVRLLVNHFGDEAPTIGSLNTLYQGLSNLENSHFWTDTGKQILLNARNSLAFLCQKLKLNLDDSKPTKYFTCPYRCNHVGMNRDDLKCICGNLMNSAVILSSSKFQTASNDDDGVFTKKTATFLITDDLQVVPNSGGVCIQILNNLGIRDTNELEERTVAVGSKEIMELLKASLFSTTPLTDVIIHKSQMVSTNIAISQLPQITEDSTTKKMILKAIIRKSTNKVLLAQADEDFIDFLFSLLTIPLGRVVCLLGSNTCLGSVDNLYRSITNLDTERYLNNEDLKIALLKPQLPPEYLSKNQIFSHTEVMTNPYTGSNTNMNFVDLNSKSGYVRGPAMFMVTDDLVVTPSSAISTLSLLKDLKIPFSDVEELRFEIGMEEALNILKSSLTSTSALTDGLKPISKRQVKQEK